MKHKNAFLFAALALALVLAAFSVGQVSATTGCFSDTNGHWAEVFICWMKDEGITSGVRGVYSDEPFAADGFGERSVAEGDVRRPMGSISYLPAMFGLQMAAEAIRLLLATDGDQTEKKI